MDENLQEDWLDAKLREETVYLDDAGFTARVVQKLPRTHQVRYWTRAAILIGLTVLASLIAYFVSGGGMFIAESVARFALLPLPVILLSAVGTTFLVMIGSLAAVMSRTGGK